MPRRSLLALAPAILLAACARGDGAAAEVNAECRVLRTVAPLPSRVDESSGLAASHLAPDMLWTHNDSGGEPELYAIRSDGSLVATVAVGGARNRDWEDLAVGPCDAGRCLYIGDIGDNEAARSEVVVYRLPEPAAADGETPTAERFTFSYPGGPRDAEALFVLPGGELYVISKGRTSNIAIYRYPQPFRSDRTVEMEHVVDMTSAPAELGAQITAADASPDGQWVAVRSYSHLLIFRTADLLGGSAPTSVIDLAPLGQPQGEAVSLDDRGTVVLTSEASGGAARGTIVSVQCSMERAEANE